MKSEIIVPLLELLTATIALPVFHRRFERISSLISDFSDKHCTNHNARKMKGMADLQKQVALLWSIKMVTVISLLLSAYAMYGVYYRKTHGTFAASSAAMLLLVVAIMLSIIEIIIASEKVQVTGKSISTENRRFLSSR